MSDAQQTYLAHLSTLGIDATQLGVDRKGTLSSSVPAEKAPSATDRLPRLLVGQADDQGLPDLEMEDPLGRGIAVSTANQDTGLSSREPGTLVGTPGDMAPEMAAADVDTVGEWRWRSRRSRWP